MLQASVRIPADSETLDGDLVIPDRPIGLVLFAHGSGSSRHSPRNRSVAGVLHGAGIATLLFDLLTEEEEAIDAVTAELRFDIGFLGQRLLAATHWASSEPSTAEFNLGYFGASTGAAAALVAAAEHPQGVAAVVSRGGRPDLARSALPRVRAPTLLLVGGFDAPVIRMNREAFEQLECEKQLTIIPGATHLFEEPGTLDQVARLAADWFQQHFGLPANVQRSPPGVARYRQLNHGAPEHGQG